MCVFCDETRTIDDLNTVWLGWAGPDQTINTCLRDAYEFYAKPRWIALLKRYSKRAGTGWFSCREEHHERRIASRKARARVHSQRHKLRWMANRRQYRTFRSSSSFVSLEGRKDVAPRIRRDAAPAGPEEQRVYCCSAYTLF